MAETERFELSVQMYPYDGLANPDLSRAECPNSRTFPNFHAVKAHAERATGAMAHILRGYESGHTLQGGKDAFQRQRLRAESAKSARRATSETGANERPLEGLAPFTTVHDIAGQLQTQNILSRNRGQGLNGREGSDEHYPYP